MGKKSKRAKANKRNFKKSKVKRLRGYQKRVALIRINEKSDQTDQMVTFFSFFIHKN